MEIEVKYEGQEPKEQKPEIAEVSTAVVHE